jgi:hypothetical protein
MQLRTLLAVSSLLLVGCESMPKRPVVRMCILNFGCERALCGDTTGEASLLAEPDQAVKEALKTEAEECNVKPICDPKKQMAKGELCQRPVPEMDKSTAFVPREWQKVNKYKDDLETWGKDHCK